MRKTNLLLLLVGILACGLLAAGCGDDDSDSTDDSATTESSTPVDTTAADTDAVTTETTEDTTTEDSGDSAGEVDTDEFLSECNDSFEGTDSGVAEDACQQAADALEECAGSANDEATIQACQDSADAIVEQLQAVG